MTAPAIPLEAANGLALDLLRQLLPHIGNPHGIEAELQRWIDALGVPHMSLVLLEAVRLTFAEALTLTPLTDVPAERLALLPHMPERRTA